MNKIVVLALGAVILTACQTAEPGKAQTIAWLQTQGMDAGSATLLANNKPALRQYLSNRSMAPQDDQYCLSLGASRGGDAYVNCRSTLAASRSVPDAPRQTVVVEREARPWAQPAPIQPWPTVRCEYC